MPNLRDIKLRIKSVRKTQKLTNAMKMVAAARLRRVEMRLENARRFHGRLQSIFSQVDASELMPNEVPLIQGHAPGGDIGLVVIAGERGLCGAFNNLIIQRATQLYERARMNTKLICLGRKGLTYFTRHNFPIIFGRAGITENMTYVQASEMAHEIIDLYNDGVVDEVQLLYQRFESMVIQRLVHERIIPALPAEVEQPNQSAVKQRENGETGVEPARRQIIYEPEPAALLQRLAPFMVAAHLYRAINESAASELAARRMAMENATDNADELIRTLGLAYNRMRQNVITSEILEVVVGGESLK